LKMYLDNLIDLYTWKYTQFIFQAITERNTTSLLKDIYEY